MNGSAAYGFSPSPFFRATPLLSALALTLLCGCSTTPRLPLTDNPRPFVFANDTFAYANELVWEYHFDETGRWVHERREPPSQYAHHCFAVARSARQLFQFARFDPTLPASDTDTCLDLIRRVVSMDPRRTVADADRIVIPGYASLRDFSMAREDLLKRACGGASQSYFQRGNWRMIFPFSRAHQARMAAALAGQICCNLPPVVHVVRFPRITINHAMVLFDVTQTDTEIRFITYDPNQPAHPVALTFDRATRTFYLPADNAFAGGPVDVYQVYSTWNY